MGLDTTGRVWDEHRSDKEATERVSPLTYFYWLLFPPTSDFGLIRKAIFMKNLDMESKA